MVTEVVREDAHFPGNLHGFFGDGSRRKLGVLGERGRGGLANGPPLPMAAMPVSGSMTSPLAHSAKR